MLIVSPKIVVVMGHEALGVVNDLDIPLRRDLVETAGVVQNLTPSIEALYVPDIDDSLDEESAKREFWAAFQALGRWWADLPPY
jgi:uracil-DNA glycosylase